ncbi:MAG: SpoIIE family protein phosphatase, partial [Streptosporangiaceae bacterium]
GVLLGADPDLDYEEATMALCPGDTLALFTDGLVERRDESIDESMASLLAFAADPAGDIASFADHLLGHARSDTSDDACLVAVRVR